MSFVYKFSPLPLSVKAGAHYLQQFHQPSQDLESQASRGGGKATISEGRRQIEAAQHSGVAEVHQSRSFAASLLKDLDPLTRQRVERVGHEEEIGIVTTFCRSMNGTS